MYKVYCDDVILYHPNIPELNILNPKLDLEVNKNGTFSFTIYSTHPYFHALQKLKSLITVYSDDEIIFRGRILNDTRGFKNEKQVTCEGALAFLLDTTQRPYEFTGDIPQLFEKFINEHNKQVEAAKQFKIGKITVIDKNGYINRSDTQYLSTHASLFKKLIETHGGYLNVRYEADGMYLDYLADFDRKSSQTIELCKNILDLKEITKGDEIYTALIPLGAKAEGSEERLTIKDVNNGKDYVYSEAGVKKFGWIFRTQTWDDVTLPENLLRKAKEEIANAFAFVNTLEITAVDLAGTGEKVSSFRIGTYNDVISPLHGIKELLLVTKLSINLTNPKGDKLVLGKTVQTFTEQTQQNNNSIGNIIEKVEHIQNTVQGAPVVSTTPPETKTVLWLDTSVKPSIFRRWNGTEWESVNDSGEIIQGLRQEFISNIQQEADLIQSEVSEKYYAKGETDVLLSEISTRLEQDKNEFVFSFEKFRNELDKLGIMTNSQFEKIEKYIRFVDGKIILGVVGNELELKIQNDRLSFLQNNVEVAYFSNRKLYVTDGEYTNSLTIGNFAFIPRKNGNLSFIKVR